VPILLHPFTLRNTRVAIDDDTRMTQDKPPYWWAGDFAKWRKKERPKYKPVDDEVGNVC
jgi:hypothetical protein